MRIFISFILFIFSISSTFAYTYKMSDAGYNLIKKNETCKLTRYKDSHGYSIGWGHLIKKGENYKKISQKVADELFVKDIKWVNDAINRLLKPVNHIKFTQGFIDGLGDLIYNCGEAGVKKTEFYNRLLRCRVDKKTGKINVNDFNYTVAAVKSAHIYEKGHKLRRYICHKMMMN